MNPSSPVSGESRSPEIASETPWVETPEGGLFFVNSLLVAPELVVLFPLTTGLLLRGLGMVEGPSPMLDTIPRLAAWVLPWVGWILVVPVWSTWKNLRIARGLTLRGALTGFLLIHLGFLAYTVLGWAGRVGG